uniref:Uncharacterized protein n=1 Tax=viral metagenome TaxID=1070528 RepID=A0A6C0HHG8_9ZZZZ
MADKKILLRTFNTHIFEFLDDVIRIFPDNLDIQTAKTSFYAIKQANPTIIIKTWYQYIYLPYRETIDSGNIEFFFNKDYSDDLSNLSNSKEVLKIVDTLREPVSNMTEQQKKFTMEYLQNLSKLSMLYSGI